MANKKFRILVLVFATIVVLFVTGSIGYFIASAFAVSGSKKAGKELDYLPEKIVKLETDFVSSTGIHFRSETGKLYKCFGDTRTCEPISPEPPKYEEKKKPFVETKGTYAKFSPPPSKPRQIVFRGNRGLVGHKTATQYVLLEDGEVWTWNYSGNDMGDSFPFWHLNNWLPLVVGIIAGLFAGLVISASIWFGFYPRG